VTPLWLLFGALVILLLVQAWAGWVLARAREDARRRATEEEG